MWSSSWLRSRNGAALRQRARRPRRAAHQRPNTCQLCVEVLEDRSLPSTFTVFDTDDEGAGSLRQAILDANANPGADLIAFNIAGSGVHTVAVGSTTGTALPDITDPVTVDGYSQPGASRNTLAVGDNAVLLVEIDGELAGHGVNGLHITAGGSAVQGLMIDNFLYSLDFLVGGSAILL